MNEARRPRGHEAEELARQDGPVAATEAPTGPADSASGGYGTGSADGSSAGEGDAAAERPQGAEDPQTEWLRRAPGGAKTDRR